MSPKKHGQTTTPSTRCDLERLRTFLDSDHYHLEDEGLIIHLDECESCRALIESEAGEKEQWEVAKRLLLPGEFDQAGLSTFSAATCCEQPVNQPAAVQDVLASLVPSEDPHHLGRLGTYEVTGVIGVGGMGVVLKAIDPSLDRVVAVKVMNPRLANSEQARKRFAREAKAAAAVLHPNVIPIHSVSSDSKLPFLVMACIRGGSLQKRIQNEGPLPLVEVLRIGSQIAAGLAAAHEQGLIHRDIKPENILLEEGVERVTLTDFGLARAVDDNTVTQQGAIAGTPQYMSPEQARGEQLDQQSDLFSLGCVLYAMCTGRPPFRDDTSYGVMRKIIDETPAPIKHLNSEIPDWMMTIVGKLMAKEKTERYQSAHEVHKLLDTCLGHVQQPYSNPLPRFLVITRPNRSKRKTLMKTIVVVAIVGSLIGLLVNSSQLLLNHQSGATQKDEQTTTKTAVWVADEDFQPSETTINVIDEIVSKAQKVEVPEWVESPEDKVSFVNVETRKQLGQRICENLRQLNGACPEDTAQYLNELQGLYSALKPRLNSTESSYQVYDQIAIAAWPIAVRGCPLTRNGDASEFYKALVELTRPHAAIRANDRLADAGKPTEPFGEDLQAVHVLALARSGEMEKALGENRRIVKKLEVNQEKSRLPDLTLTFLGVERSPKSLFLQTVLQEALILALNDQAAEANEKMQAAGRFDRTGYTDADRIVIQELLAAIANAMGNQ